MSNDSDTRHISYTSADIKEHTVEKMKNTRITLKKKNFTQICDSMDAGFTNFLYHAEVR